MPVVLVRQGHVVGGVDHPHARPVDQASRGDLHGERLLERAPREDLRQPHADGLAGLRALLGVVAF